MLQSFYTGFGGASQSMNRLSVIANNLANVNNTGFKPKKTSFSEYMKVTPQQGANGEVRIGVGVTASRTYTTFSSAGTVYTGSEADYAICSDNAFFMIKDPETGKISYTRDGHFHRAQTEEGFYLMTDAGKLVLDQNGEPLKASFVDVEKLTEMNSGDYDFSSDTEDEGLDAKDRPRLAVYTFENPSRLMSTSANEYIPSDASEEAILLEDPQLMQGYLEPSGTDMVGEYADLIETQRSFQYAMKAVTSADEIFQTINSLRS